MRGEEVGEEEKKEEEGVGEGNVQNKEDGSL